MVPDVTARPQVLPTERLLSDGKCRPELRAELRRIDDARNALSVAGLWLGVVAMVGLAVWVGNPWLYAAVFVAMGPVHARFAILMHESAHKLLFTNKSVNDWVGTWLVAYPAFVPISLYRRGHFAHHREEFGPNEPDLAYYGGYPCDRHALLRRLVRDAVGISGWKNLRLLLRGVRSPAYRRLSLSILGVQAVLWGGSWAATGRWWVYPALWWLPPGDTAARLGGDEFVVLCEDLQGGEAEALAVAQRISQLLAAPVALADRLVEVGASIGVAVAEPGDEAEVVLSHADEAMYEAKRNGRGRIELFRPRP